MTGSEFIAKTFKGYGVTSGAVREIWSPAIGRFRRKEVEPLRNSEALPIGPERLCKELSDFLPTNAVLVADNGYSAVWTGIMAYLTLPEPIYIRAAGSLGWAFPASIGARCASTERPVVCFTGDGGFWYHLSELETAVRCGINTVTIEKCKAP